MACDLSNTVIHFKESGTKIRPLSVDVRHSRRQDNQFDHVQAKVTKAAGEHIINNATHKEPVTIDIEGDHTLYRGYYATDEVSYGDSTAILNIMDPRRLLKNGFIDKEWNKITLENLVNYIYDQFQDPYGVISGPQFNEPDSDELKLQFEHINENNSWRPSVSNPLNTETTERNKKAGETELGIRNWLRETTPMVNGDGQFDFREETPYSALEETVDIWETDWWIKSDGTLVIGMPDLDPNAYPASRYKGDWFITQYNFPQNPTPIKGVYVKGKMDHKGGHDDNVGNDIWQWVTDKKKFETRAYAGFNNDDLTETIVLNKKNSSDPETLKEVAKRGLIRKFTEMNRGSVIIDPLSSVDVDLEGFCKLKQGDRLVIPGGWGCDEPDSGMYTVHNIQHKINGDDGWSITLQVTQDITEKLQTEFWYFDPTDADMSENGGAP